MVSLGVAVIGTGFMGKCHAMAWSHVRAVFGGETDIRLEVLCDTNEAVTKQKAQEAGFARAEIDWCKLLGDARIDIVSITTPNNLHREMSLAFLAVGKHVWCEKPMALTLEDAEAMAVAAAQANGKTLLGYNYIRNPSLAHARKIIQEGRLAGLFISADRSMKITRRKRMCRGRGARAWRLAGLACWAISPVIS